MQKETSCTLSAAAGAPPASSKSKKRISKPPKNAESKCMSSQMRDLFDKFAVIQPEAASVIASSLIESQFASLSDSASTSVVAAQKTGRSKPTSKSSVKSAALATAQSRLLEGLYYGCRFFVSPQFIPFVNEHPEVKSVIDVLALEYLALRRRAMPDLIKACTYYEMKFPGSQLQSTRTKVSSMDVILALRRWMMRSETLSEEQAENLVTTHSSGKLTSEAIKTEVKAVLETALFLTKWIQNSSAPSASFRFILMPNKSLILMETGFMAAARRRCIVCAKAGVRRCQKCGLVWYCSEACQKEKCTNEKDSATNLSVDVKSTSDVKSTTDVKSTAQVVKELTHLLPAARHRTMCKGPAFDRSVFHAAQRILSDGFRAIDRSPERANEYVVDSWRASDAAVRKSVYEGALADLGKSK